VGWGSFKEIRTKCYGRRERSRGKHRLKTRWAIRDGEHFTWDGCEKGCTAPGVKKRSSNSSGADRDLRVGFSSRCPEEGGLRFEIRGGCVKNSSNQEKRRRTAKGGPGDLGWPTETKIHLGVTKIVYGGGGRESTAVE